MANTSKIKFFSTVKSKLNNLPQVDGQLIFVEDSQEIYLDLHGVRTKYSDFIFVTTEANRKAILAPIESFYYVYETHDLWRYEGGQWFLLTPHDYYTKEEVDQKFSESTLIPISQEVVTGLFTS